MYKETLRNKIINSQVGEPTEQTNAISAVSYFYKRFAPKTLFKYYSAPCRDLTTVRNNQIWVSAPCNYNDVFDCDISINEPLVVQNVLKKMQANPGTYMGKRIQKKIRKSVHDRLVIFQNNIDEMRSTIGVACFSEVDDSILMWAHYAENHHGFCAEYSIWEIMEKTRMMPVPVVYSDARCSLDNLNPSEFQTYITELFFQSLTSKSADWSYEQEWRIYQDKIKIGDDWRYDERGALLKLVPPKSIILGYAAEKKVKDELVDLCKSRSIPLYQMKKDPRNYKLTKTRINPSDA